MGCTEVHSTENFVDPTLAVSPSVPEGMEPAHGHVWMRPGPHSPKRMVARGQPRLRKAVRTVAHRGGAFPAETPHRCIDGTSQCSAVLVPFHNDNRAQCRQARVSTRSDHMPPQRCMQQSPRMGQEASKGERRGKVTAQPHALAIPAGVRERMHSCAPSS
jgi:hypothetical protein